MSEHLSRRQTFRELLKFAFPLMIGQLGMMLIGAGDVFVATEHSTVALAAIGIAVAFTNPVFVVGMAFILPVSPLVAKRRGEGTDSQHLALSALCYSLLLSIPFVLFTWLTSLLVPLMNYDLLITESVVSYIRITAWSIPGIFVYIALKEWLQAHERTLWATGVSIAAVAANLWFNRIYTFGLYGFPALGIDGLAWASLTVRYLLGLAMLLPLLRQIFSTKSIDRAFLRETLLLGAPTAVAMFFEVMAFCSVTLFVGQFGQVQTAANNLALTLASCTFMIPLALSSAVSVKVGHAFGEKNSLMIQRYAWTGLICSLSFMALSALTFSLYPRELLGFFGADISVVEYGALLIFWVAIFQIFDGAQVTLGAILRGVGIARPVTIVTFVGYWIIGIPLGWWLANRMGYQGQGFWVGLATSLGLVSIALYVLTVYKVKHAVE